MDWTSGISVVLTGVSVVFSVLIILVFLVWAVGKIFISVEASKKQKMKQAAPVPQSKQAPKVEYIEEGISDEVVAAITAAISTVMSSEGNANGFAVKSIKRVKEGRSAWNSAGIMENTRPF